jgi:hypothetical protein
LFFLTIQLIGSAPTVSNFASYRGVLIVITRLGAELEVVVLVELFATTGAAEGLAAGVFSDCGAGVCDAPGWPFWFCGGFGVK